MIKTMKKSIAVFLAVIFIFGVGLVSGSQVHAEDFTEKSNVIMKNESLLEENKAVGEEDQNKNLKPLQSPLLKADPVSTKTFTVTKHPIADSSNKTLVGEYDTFHDAIEACKQEDLSNQYVVTMNKDYTIPATEGWWGKSNINMLLKSKDGATYTLKREGNRNIMAVDKKTTLRIENVILDGNSDGQAFMVAGGDDENGANLILGKGAVIQNFKDNPNYLGTTFYLAEGNSILTIEDGAVLQNNTAKESGGIIQARANTTINIKGGLFKNNSSKSGGGVLFTNGKLNITGGTFENNQGKYGGALWLGSTSTATVENAIFRNNTTTSSYGGAIWGSNEFKVKNSTFEKNQAKWGGAIYSVKNMTIEGSTFKDNEAAAGGALAIYGNIKMTVKDSKFIGNSATFAGAIYIINSTEESTMSGCTFTENEATKKGAAIWSNNAPISIEDSTFQNNGNYTKYGGGLCVNGNKTFNVKNSIFKGNQAKFGGGIFVMGGKLSVEGTTLESNIAAGIGGAILSLKDEQINSEMIISKSLIKNNEALNGAGVTVQSGKVEIKDTEFNGNDTKGPENDQDKRLGGALYVDVDANVNISEASKFIGNKAGLGGAIFDASADYSNPADTSKYQNLKIDATTLFKGNEARTGLHQPPINFEKFDNLLFSEKSDVPHDKYMSKSLLNNYDINYQGGLLITYDANGGKFTDGKSIKQESHKENDTITIIEAPMREGYQFLYWKGSEYNPGDEYTVKDSHAFVAQWNKIPELEVKDKTITKGEDLDLMSLVVKATDEEDGDLTKDVKIINNGGFDKDKVGEYTVTFEVKDSKGATAKATAKVTVKRKAEVINEVPTLKVKDKTITKGEGLDLMSLVVKATDKEDGNLIDKVKIVDNGGFDKDKVGEYTVTFEVKDSKGATAKAKAKVTVKRKAEVINEVPTLEVKDKTITKGDDFNLKSLVVKATDKEDGNLIDKVKIVDNGGFDKDKVGEYTVTFEVKDSKGATAKATAKVTVKRKAVYPDPPKPAEPEPKNPAKPDPKNPAKPEPKKPVKPEPKKPVKPEPQKPVVNTKVPQTGDSSNVGIFTGLLGLSGGALAVLIALRKRKMREEN